MNLADIATWLTDLSPESPCGEDEEYSADFRSLEQAIAGKPDAQYGGTVIAATPPDWTLAHSLATSLLARTRDLRVAVHYTRASMVREDFIGLAGGLALIEGLLARHWDSVHPQLDASDGDDPTARVNALSALVDGAGLAGELRDTPFVAPRGQRGFTLRDMEVLAGEAPPLDDEMPTVAAIDAAFAQAGVEAGRAQCDALASARASLAQIESVLTGRVGPARALDFGPLARPLGRIAEFVAARVAALDPLGLDTRRVSGAMEATPSEEGAGTAVATHAAADRPAAPRRIASTREVSDALDAICAYYDEHEPSSPLPVLLQRARRLVGKSFMEIIEDVAPDGAHQFRHLGGVV
jgi:type VI secretion system protein ImpA